MIEISDTGNDCFERAILFVRPDKIDKDGDHIRRRAVDYLSGIKLRPWFYPKGRTALKIIGWVTSALVGAGVTALFFLL